jgi:hypothetical protein
VEPGDRRLNTTLAASPSCHVSGIFAYMAGPPGDSDADAGGWFTLFQGDGTLNAAGLAYLDFDASRRVAHRHAAQVSVHIGLQSGRWQAPPMPLGGRSRSD